MPSGVYVRKVFGPRLSLAERFWPKVQKSDGCWIWLGKTNKGYGVVIVRSHRVATYLGAHRVAWELAHGPIGDGLCVCHRCDNPQCVRPDHLFLGSNADNLADMRAKGRHARGPGRGAKKLTWADVDLIRLAAETLPVTLTAIARAWGVSIQTISQVVRNRAWA